MNLSRRFRIFCAVTFLLGGIAAMPAAQAAVIELELPDAAKPGEGLAVGEVFTATLVGRGFDRSTIGGGVNLFFDPAILRLDSVSFQHSAFDFQKQVNAVDNRRGVVDSVLVSSILTEHNGRFAIAELAFTAIGAGISPLSLAPSDFAAPWLTSLGDEIDTIYAASSVQVVPLPPGLTLLASGVGMTFFKMRRKS
ncbi:hypothetical protein [Methylococcus sp. EFPC2]|uniref:hypothetical protein n=1 Tax=Methylococcus sp. EFPC2 TaxID=2812648 RepID=UPI00196739F5|nr:hypothetical protein [Methylococcus sp. EFPC2]QSA95835.1 hypothetical protein JWZ97_11345 [Methylococcus sp. EFPC2]